MFVQSTRANATVEEDGFRSSIDKGKEDITGDLSEVHPRDELLECLEPRVDRLSIKFVIEWGRGECRPLMFIGSDYGRPEAQNWTYGIIECAPLGVYDHLSTTGPKSFVLELGQLAQVLDVSSVGAGSKYRAKQTAASSVRS